LTRFATYVVGCSEAMDRHHAEFFGLPARRRAVIQNGVNFYPASFEAVQALKNNLPQRVRQRRICLTVARLAQQKGHRFLLEAIARLPLNLRWEWCFVLAGDGELADQLQAQAAQLGLGEELHFLGHTTQVPAWLALAEVFVLPSLYEGLPLSLLEAMAQGLPCIATAVDGNREVLRDQENGLLCPAADGPSLAQTLEVLLTNPAFRQRLGNQAQADYQSYWTFERTWQAYETLYRRLSGASTLETLQLHSFK
jgi:glycosyltransferase involved in cell wall biosynthesis